MTPIMTPITRLPDYPITKRHIPHASGVPIDISI